jgi:hypothetical protein
MTEWNIATIRRTHPTHVSTTDGITVFLDWNRVYTWPNPYQAATHNVGRGICATVTGVPQEPPLPFLAVDYATHIPWAWQQDKPVEIWGIEDTDAALDAALDDLIDTARAHRAYNRNRDARSAKTMDVLTHAFQDLQDAMLDGVPGTPERYRAVQDAQAHRDQMIALALADGLLTRGEIAFAARTTAAEVDHMAAYATVTPPTYYLSLDGFANRIGVDYQTIKAYRSRDLLPPPDITLGGSPGWLLATADKYQTDRRGRGFRSDLLDPTDPTTATRVES